MKLLEVVPADNNKHKYVATFDNNGKIKKTYFGALGYNDYTLYYANEGSVIANKHKQRYLKRHEKDLKTNDPTRAGYLSYYILWNKPTVEASIRDYRRSFGL